MNGKIALEEHFALPDTLGDSEQYAVAGSWGDLQHKLLDLGDRAAARDGSTRHRAVDPVAELPGDPGHFAIHAPPSRRLSARTTRWPTPSPGGRDRFAGFAALPMQDADAAALELTRGVRDLGFKGTLVNGFSERRTPGAVVYYDDPVYAPFWSVVEQLGVPFYLHPRDPLPAREPIYDGHPWFRGSAWAFGAETAMHALRLMASGLFDRHPRLTMILGHLGEGLPCSVWRIDHRLRKSPRGIPARRTMSEYLRSNVYLTTSGNFRTPTLAGCDRRGGQRSHHVLGGLPVRGDRRRSLVVRCGGDLRGRAPEDRPR